MSLASQVTLLATAVGTDVKALFTAVAGKLDTSAAPELIRDTMNTAIVQGANMTITPSDVGDIITFASASNTFLFKYTTGSEARPTVPSGVIVIWRGPASVTPTNALNDDGWEGLP